MTDLRKDMCQPLRSFFRMKCRILCSGSQLCLFLLLFTGSCFMTCICALKDDSGVVVDYGADVSWPIHYSNLHHGPMGDRNAIYQEFLRGCREYYGEKGSRCDADEQGRLDMSLRQPQSMVNYTSTGFMKIPAPKRVRELLDSYWEKNKDKGKVEQRPVGNVYLNNWRAPSYMISVEDTNLRGGGMILKNAVWDAAKATIEEWTGMEQSPISLYGIRVYTEGAILSPHVDRLPLVSSCIVNVAQDVDEPWPLEVYDRQGNAVNITMEPGDMVLYESHSLIHGRPFPLKGRFFANIFIHFEPTGRKLADVHGNRPVPELDDFFPPYIIPNSPESTNWKAYNVFGWKKSSPAVTRSSIPKGHVAAADGDIATLIALAQKDKELLHAKDENGWQPLHEAVRAGHTHVVKMLLEHNADINSRTHFGAGRSPLNLAITSLSEEHPLIDFLIENGALDIEPEL